MPTQAEHQRLSAAIVNPFDPPVNRVADYTAQEIATLQSRLDKQLGPEYISTRPGQGGGKVHYLAAEKVINLANEVFGFNGWSSQIQNVQVDFCDEVESTGKISLGLSIIMRVTLRDGAFHEDIGYGHIENCKGKAAAFEKAKKEAATDALKRALRNFGNVLGNCLYDKEYLAKVSKVKIAPSKWDAENLHRHPDFAPIKREAIADIHHEENRGNVKRENTPSVGGIELEDEFGGDIFDEGDLSGARPDEVVMPPSATKDRPNQKGPGGSGQQIRRSVSNPMPPPQQPPQRNISQQQNTRPTPQPQSHGQAQHPPQTNAVNSEKRTNLQPSPPQSLPQSPANAPTKTTSVPAPNHIPTHDTSMPPPQRPQQQAYSTPPFQQGLTATVNDHTQAHARPQSPDHPQHPPQPNQPQRPPSDPPIGFITSRHADILIKQDGPPPLPNSIRFNPNAESPSIRKTAGFNHATSAPVSRTAISVPATTSTSAANAAGAQAQSPVTGASAGANGPGPATQRQPTNFVNPAENVGRRIGMPGVGLVSPLVGRASAYKPPSVIGGKRLYAEAAGGDVGNGSGGGGGGAGQRPPLADLSNTHQPVSAAGVAGKGQSGDGEDAKRPRLGEA